MGGEIGKISPWPHHHILYYICAQPAHTEFTMIYGWPFVYDLRLAIDDRSNRLRGGGDSGMIGPWPRHHILHRHAADTHSSL